MLHGSAVKVGDDENEYFDVIPVFEDQNIIPAKFKSVFFSFVAR